MVDYTAAVALLKTLCDELETYPNTLSESGRREVEAIRAIIARNEELEGQLRYTVKMREQEYQDLRHSMGDHEPDGIRF